MPRVYLAGPPFAEEYRRRATTLVAAAGWEPVDPMRRDFRGQTEGHEAEIVYTGGTPSHPWTRYVAASVHSSLEDGVAAST